MTRTRGFTLIELLVVISVIALLMAILLPTMQAARETARRARCLANIRQLGLGFASYVADTGKAPTLPDNGLGGKNRPDAAFARHLRQYLNVDVGATRPDAVTFCPSQQILPRDLNSLHGMHYMGVIGSWHGQGGNQYTDRQFWVRAERLPLIPNGGAMLYAEPIFALPTGGWTSPPSFNWLSNTSHGFKGPSVDILTPPQGGNVVMYDGSARWTDGERDWINVYTWEGQHYPRNHLLIRHVGLGGALEAFGPQGAGYSGFYGNSAADLLGIPY